MNIETKFMGLDIKSPIIVGSCGLTSDVETLKRIEKAGAGAVILKSIFEEQILQEMSNNYSMSNAIEYADETYDYIVAHTEKQSLAKYINLIRSAKEAVSIPVIASVNCVSSSQWINFATRVEQAGADGIELNMFVLPSDVNLTTDNVEKFYENVIHNIKKVVKIPVSVKISSYFSSLARFAQKLSWMGIENLNIFNQFSKQDINIDTMTIEPANVFSSPNSLHKTIRWTAILANVLNCPITAGGGVHKPQDIIKLLLAGANTVQTVSAIYEQGTDFIEESIAFLKEWMQKNNFESLGDFRGKLAVEKNNESSAFLRVQFMKYFAGIK
ncbi:MAG: dihydroorotate dehydrogenase-like protein [Bacteroidales bacterium]|nr:dihydroorotate dehydrogenase-like protein [Bacteroidales bacterium]